MKPLNPCRLMLVHRFASSSPSPKSTISRNVLLYYVCGFDLFGHFFSYELHRQNGASPPRGESWHTNMTTKAKRMAHAHAWLRVSNLWEGDQWYRTIRMLGTNKVISERNFERAAFACV